MRSALLCAYSAELLFLIRDSEKPAGFSESPFHRRGRGGKRHLLRRFLRKRGATGKHRLRLRTLTIKICCTVICAADFSSRLYMLFFILAYEFHLTHLSGTFKNSFVGTLLIFSILNPMFVPATEPSTNSNPFVP